jgi:MFS family permease
MKIGWFKSIIPFKIVSAIFSTLVILVTISIGGNAREVSLVVTTLTIGSLLGSIFFGSIVFRTNKRISFFTLGFLGLIFSNFLLFFTKDFLLILIGAFSFSFLTSSIFFAAYALISDKYKNVNRAIGRFEEVGGWGYVIGLIIGFFITSFLGLEQIFFVLGIFSIASLFYVFWIFKRRILLKLAQTLLKDFGILTWVEKGVEFAIKGEEMIAEKTLTSLHHIVKGSFIPSFHIIRVELPRKNLLLHLTFLLFFISLGLVYSQVITLMKEKGITDSLVFGFSLISSTLSAAFYSKAGSVKKPENIITKMLVLRALMFLMLIISVFLFGISFMIFLFIFFFLDGYSWSYIVIPSNSLILRKLKKEIGINNFFRSLGYIIGSFLSGILIFYSGFIMNFSIAIVILIISIFLFLKTEEKI